MNFKEYLKSLKWNSFSTYPPQGEDIILHRIDPDGTTHRFVEVKSFNATTFKPWDIIKNTNFKDPGSYGWLLAKHVRRSFAELNS